MDFALGAVLATIALGFMGAWVTLRPPPPKWHKHVLAAFLLVGIAGASATFFDGREARREAAKQQTTLDKVRAETEQLRADLKGESIRREVEIARREQAEKDIALMVKKSSEDTRTGVAEDFRKSPIKVDIPPSTEPLKITTRLMRMAGDVPPFLNEALLLTNRLITPVRLTVECDSDLTKVDARIVGASSAIVEGPARLSARAYRLAILSPAWTPSDPLLVTIHSNNGDIACKFNQN